MELKKKLRGLFGEVEQTTKSIGVIRDISALPCEQGNYIFELGDNIYIEAAGAVGVSFFVIDNTTQQISSKSFEQVADIVECLVLTEAIPELIKQEEAAAMEQEVPDWLHIYALRKMAQDIVDGHLTGPEDAYSVKLSEKPEGEITLSVYSDEQNYNYYTVNHPDLDMRWGDRGVDSTEEALYYMSDEPCRWGKKRKTK